MFRTVSQQGWVDESKMSWYKPKYFTRLYFDTVQTITRGNRNIFIQVEPTAIYESMWKFNIRQFLIQNWKRYDKILTFDQDILNACPNAVSYVYGTTWIKPHEYSSVRMEKKEFKVSSITGEKGWTVGHVFRTNLYMRQQEIPIPHVCFKSKVAKTLPSIEDNPTLGDSKAPLFDAFQFSLVIENSRQINYFTEKLVDCLLMKTIPVYYGCPNIDRYFDTRGWIILDTENVDDAFAKLSTLTPEWYSHYTDVIESNAQKALSVSDFYVNLSKVLQ
jgi:hypothetical protein